MSPPNTHFLQEHPVVVQLLQFPLTVSSFSENYGASTFASVSGTSLTVSSCAENFNPLMPGGNQKGWKHSDYAYFEAQVYMSGYLQVQSSCGRHDNLLQSLSLLILLHIWLSFRFEYANSCFLLLRKCYVISAVRIQKEEALGVSLWQSDF